MGAKCGGGGQVEQAKDELNLDNEALKRAVEHVVLSLHK